MKKTTVRLRERHRRYNLQLLHFAYLRRSPIPNKHHNKSQFPASLSIHAPQTFSLRSEEHRNVLFSFIRRLRSALSEGQRVRILFAQTKQLFPCGTLYFVAHILLVLEHHPGRLSCDYPQDDVVEQLFQHIGLLAKLGLSNRKQITAENVKHWHFVSGHTTDTSPFSELLSTYQTSIQTPVRMGLYDSMSEAVTNCIQHAYQGSKCGDNMKHWWMFSQRQDNKLHVVICDLGIGIPGSLRQKPEWRDIIRRFSGRKKQDKALIKAAVGSLRTRTGLAHRGKGLPEMLDFVRSGNIGGFLVYSNHGAFAFEAQTGVERAKYYEQPFYGTLIQWELALHDGG